MTVFASFSGFFSYHGYRKRYSFRNLLVYKKALNAKPEQIIKNMMQLEGLNSIFNGEPINIRNNIKQLTQNLELLVSYEDKNLEPIHELKKTIAEIERVEGLDLDSTDIQAIRLKAEELYMVANSLLELGEKYQNLFSKELVERIRYWSNRIEGIGKRFEIRSLINVKDASDLSNEEEIKFINLLAEFVEKYSETHPEEVADLGEFAQQLSKAKKTVGEPTLDEWLSQPGFYRNSYLNAIYLSHGNRLSEESFVAYKRGEERFVRSALSSMKKIQDKQKEKDIEDTIDLIDSWETKYTTEEMHETLEKFKKEIDEDRGVGRKLFS